MSRPRTSRQPPPGHTALAQLYSQLALLQQAGIPLSEALAKLDASPLQQRIRRTRQLMQGGIGLAEAGRRSGLFQGFDARLLLANEVRGDYAFSELAKRHESLARRYRTLRSRMVKPAALLALALLIQPLPELVSGQMDIGGYLGATLGVGLLLLFCGYLLARLPGWLRRHGLGNSLDRTLLSLPWLGKLIRRRSLVEFSRAFGLLLKAGVPILEALPVGVEGITNGPLRERLAGLEMHLRAGLNLEQALGTVADLDSRFLALVGSGEQAGRIDQMLLHYVALEEVALDADEESLMAWIPRLSYALVACWIGWSMLIGDPGSSMEMVERIERGY